MTQEPFRDPYSSQNRRDDQAAISHAATHTPDSLPEHLRDAMAAAEENFAKTAPGVKNPVATETGPSEVRVREPEVYVDPTTGEAHEIDLDRPFTDADAATLVAKAGRKTLTIAQMNANEQAHIAKARADRRASGF